MDRAAELHFAFDVDDLAAAGPRLAGDAGGTPEGEAADLDDAEAVDLSDARALGGDQRDPLDDRLLRAVAYARGAAHAGLQRAIDVGARHQIALGLARAKIRLDQRLAQIVDAQRKLAGMVGEARGVLDDARGRLRVERLEAVAARQRGHKPREDRFALRVAREVVLEIGEKS